MRLNIKRLILEGYSYEAIVKNIIEEGAVGKVWKNLADQHGLERVNASKTRKENLFQYLTNPFVDGPLKHMTATIKQSFLNALIAIFSDEKVTTIKELEAKLETIAKGSGPYARQSVILAEELRKRPELHRQLIDEHFIQWLINPLVPGPLDQMKLKKMLKEQKSK